MEIWQEIDKWIDFTNDYIILNIIGVAFTIQIIYILFFFVKPKKYKVSEKKHRFAIVIPARNESAVIGDTIKCLLAQNCRDSARRRRDRVRAVRSRSQASQGGICA